MEQQILLPLFLQLQKKPLLLIMIHQMEQQLLVLIIQQVAGTLTFAPSETTKNVPVVVIQDTTDEENETVTVTLSNPSEVTL